ELVDGSRIILGNRTLLVAFLASGGAMFLMSSLGALISIYVRDTLGAGALLYGGVSAMIGAGLIAGSVVVRRTARERPMANVVAGLWLVAAAAAILGALRLPLTAALSTFLLGAGIAFVVVPARTLSQSETPPPMQGR